MFLQAVCSQRRIENRNPLCSIIMVEEHKNILIFEKKTQNKEVDGTKTKRRTKAAILLENLKDNKVIDNQDAELSSKYSENRNITVTSVSARTYFGN